MGRDYPDRYQPRFPRRGLLVRPHASRYQRQRVRLCARAPQDHSLPLRCDGHPVKLHGRRRRRRHMECDERNARHGHQYVLRLPIGEVERRKRRRRRRDVHILERECDDVVWFFAGQCQLGCVPVTEFFVSAHA
jgi:hypothetical protein